jgi:hypothetical protein
MAECVVLSVDVRRDVLRLVRRERIWVVAAGGIAYTVTCASFCACFLPTWRMYGRIIVNSQCGFAEVGAAEGMYVGPVEWEEDPLELWTDAGP